MSKLLLQVDPACKLNYAIRGAVDAGHAAVVAVLVSDPRVDPTVLHDYCVRTAAEKGFTEARHDKEFFKIFLNVQLDCKNSGG